MTQSKLKRGLALVCGVMALVLLITGIVCLPSRNSAKGQDILDTLRIRSLLIATGEGVVESYVNQAKSEARDRVKAEGGKAAAIRDAVAAAEKAAREQYSNQTVDYTTLDTTQLEAAVADYVVALTDYNNASAAAKAEYVALHEEETRLAMEAEREAKIAAGEDVPESYTITVDMTGFEPTEDMLAKAAVEEEAFAAVAEAFKGIYPVMDDDTLSVLKPTIAAICCQEGDTFCTQYDRYMDAGAGVALTNSFTASLVRYADDIIYGALFLIVLALVLVFTELLITKLGVPRLIIGLFFILLCFLVLWFDLSLSALLSNTIVRMGMNAVMVLAMVPGIQCGISLNLGLPIGMVGGLIGGLMAIEFSIPGWAGFLFAIVVGIAIAMVTGYLYGQLLNRLKGQEMSVTTYVGFSIISLMCIFWLRLPFQSLKLRWPLGTGLRNTIGLDSTNFKHVLDDFLSFKIGSLTIPTGLILFMLLCCFLVWLFSRSKTGIAMQAVGNNPRFAEATGINVNKMRIIGTMLSTVLGAVGILVYSQSYGFMQLYNAPRQMGFIAASAILIGGASTSRCKISHVLIGTFLFQGVLTLGMPVANVLVPGSTISETLRILISNGIILYALTKSGGGNRG